jgi:hypothetical protein
LGKTKGEDSQVSRKKKPKTYTTPESREKEMIALAMDAVEQRIREGKASSAELVHFLKLGTERSKLEQQKLEKETKLLTAKTESIEQQKEIATMIKDATSAMMRYRGNPIDDDESDDYDDF